MKSWYLVSESKSKIDRLKVTFKTFELEDITVERFQVRNAIHIVSKSKKNNIDEQP